MSGPERAAWSAAESGVAACVPAGLERVRKSERERDASTGFEMRRLAGSHESMWSMVGRRGECRSDQRSNTALGAVSSVLSSVHVPCGGHLWVRYMHVGHLPPRCRSSYSPGVFVSVRLRALTVFPRGVGGGAVPVAERREPEIQIG